MERKDIRKYIEKCQTYTDFDKEGNDLVKQI
jgi:hypothetical protein